MAQGGNFYSLLRGFIVGVGGLAFGTPRTVLATPDTLTQADFQVHTNLTVAGAVALTLPDGTGVGQLFWIKDAKRDAGTNNVTITPAAGETIDGGATYVISANGGAVLLYKTSATTWVSLTTAASAGSTLAGLLACFTTSNATTFGAYGVTPVARPAAYTQTYSTAARTNANATTATLVDNSGGAAADTVAAITNGANAGSADVAPVANAIATLVREQARQKADFLMLQKLVNAMIDDRQADGLAQ